MSNILVLIFDRVYQDCWQRKEVLHVRRGGPTVDQSADCDLFMVSALGEGEATFDKLHTSRKDTYPPYDMQHHTL